MKTVLILRHGKSDWSDDGEADFDRPLAKRGREDAPRMGQLLARFQSVPDLILTSPARRARHTAELVAKACGYERPVQAVDAFYGGSSLDLVTELQRLPASVERPLLVGHNPTAEETVAALCGGEMLAVKMPTAGLACLAFDIDDWASLEPGGGVLHWLVIPKLVKALQE